MKNLYRVYIPDMDETIFLTFAFDEQSAKQKVNVAFLEYLEQEKRTYGDIDEKEFYIFDDELKDVNNYSTQEAKLADIFEDTMYILRKVEEIDDVTIIHLNS